MLTYKTLTTQQYVNAVVDVISKTEGYLSTVTDLNDGMSTIGYGYTLERNNNVALWQAAGITLSAAEWEVLRQIDLANSDQKTVIALTQFGKILSNEEAKALLGQTYQKYESPANQIAMPESWERVALISITYNRGASAVNSKMQDFFSAISSEDRAEAWFQIRYNAQTSNLAFVNGIAKRRYYESDLFGLYNDADNVSDEEAKQIYRMLQRHHTQISDYEETYSGQIDQANAAYGSKVKTLAEALQPARDYLVAEYVTNQGIAIDINGDILVGTDNSIMGPTVGGQDNLIGKDTLSNTSPMFSNDLILGEGGNDTLGGGAGDDVLYGGAGDDSLTGSDGNDVLIGGTEQDTLTGEDGNDTLHGDDGAGGDILDGGTGFDTYYADDGDTIRDADGKGNIYLNGKLLTFATRNKGETFWTDAAGNTFTLNGTTLQVNDPLTIEGFSNGQLGIYLDEQEDPSNPLPGPSYNPTASVRRWDPLVLDLNGNGQIDAVSSTASTTYFDFNGDGISEKSGWVAAQDGILGLDANNNGIIDNLSELFGSATEDGFIELAGLDSTQDGVMDAQDTDYSQLRIWQDSNQDGISQSEELHTLTDLNITAINLATTPANLAAADNLITATGSFTRNGQSQLAADIHLTVNFTQTDSNPNRPLDQAPTLSADVFDLPWLRGYGLVKSLHVAYEESVGLKQAAIDLISQGRDSILANFDGFLAQWSGLTDAHVAHGVSRTDLTTEDKVWVLETFTGQDVNKSAIEAANFGTISLGARRGWDTSYIETQYQSFAKREAIGFAIQATAKDLIQGAYYSLAGDRFVAIDAAQLQTSLVQGLSAISNKQDALFAAVTLDRLRNDGVDLQAATLKPALAALPYAQAYEAAIDGRLAFRINAGTLSVSNTQDWLIYGSSESDVLYGNGGNDMLDGGAGNDTLIGGGGNDTLVGSSGVDILDGGAGNDIYQFGRGDGHDSISSYDTAIGETDQIQFNVNVASTDIDLSRTHNDLALTIRGTEDSITIKNYFIVEAANPYGVEQIKFADGTVWDFDAIKNLFPVIATSGHDTVYGYDAAEVINAGLGNDTVYALGGDDTVNGEAGNDSLFGEAGNDILNGGAGNDSLQGGIGNDTYAFGRGSGQDTIDDYDPTAGNIDTVRIDSGVLPADVKITRDFSSLYLNINNLDGTADKLTLQNWFSQNAYKIEQVVFADDPATVWNVAALSALANAATENADYIEGTAGGDILNGLAGNDTVIGGEGNDTLDGGAGSDFLQGSVGNDILMGGDDNDSLQGGTGNDTLDGGAGNDTLFGGTGNDTYMFERGFGQDIIYDNDTTAGNVDTIRFGAGIVASDIGFARNAGDLVLSIDGMTDQLRIQNWDNGNTYHIERVEFADGMVWGPTDLPSQLSGMPIMGTSGNDNLSGDAGSNTLDGWTGNDTLKGGAGSDIYVFERGSGQDTIYDNDATAGNVDTIRFGAGIVASDIGFGRNGGDLVLSINGMTDQLRIQNWDNGNTYHIERVEFADGTVWGPTDLPSQLSGLPIMGTSGNDNLSGDAGSNTLDGWTGNDTLKGGAGNDIYVFERGSGQDTISEYDSTVSNVDTLRFGTGIAASDITFSRSGADLVLGINGTTDQVTIQNWKYGYSYHIEQVEFTDGTVWDAAYLQTQFSAVPIVGTAGNDTLAGDTGNNTLDGGAGNDTLSGGTGNDIYLFNLGGGQDTISEYDSTVGNVDTLRFGAGIAASDITFSRNGTNLILGINGTTDQVTIQNWEYGNYYRIERVQFADGTIWNAAYLQTQVSAVPIVGTAGNDTLAGDTGNNTLDGGAGNDTLSGGTGNDIYLFNLGGGQDTISDYDSTVGNVDTLRFGAGIAASDITFSRSGTDLVLGINGTTDQVTIHNWGYGNYYRIERVEFADGAIWNAAYLQTQFSAVPIVGTAGNDTLAGDTGNNTLDGGAGNDTLSGGKGNDTYLFNLGSGQDTISEYDSTVGNVDTLRFGAGIDASDITFSRSGTDLVLGINGTTDQLTIQNWKYGYSYHIERVEFTDGTMWDAAYLQAQVSAVPIVGTAGNDTLVGDTGNNTLDGGAGNDYLGGGSGNDVYVFGLGSGQDRVVDYDAAVGNVDTLRFGAGIAASDITFSRSGTDLVLGINGTTDQLTLDNWGEGDYYRIERVEFADGAFWDASQLQALVPAGPDPISGTEGGDDLRAWAGENSTLQGLGGDDFLYGNNVNDILDGGAGNDFLTGGTGNDTYLFNLGGGQDTILDYDSTVGNVDTLRFGAGIAAGDITLSNISNALVLGIKGTTDQVTIHNWENGYSYHIERVEFADGTIWNENYLNSAIPIVGDDRNNHLIGSTGNNTFDGRAGNDTLLDGLGNDTYLFNLGSGQDTISEYDSTAGNVDALRFGAGIDASDITVSRSGADLVLGINGTTDQVTIQNWGYGDYYRIERVEFADGAFWDAAQLQALVPAGPISGTEGADVLNAWSGVNSTLQGLGGDDSLDGRNGNDILDGGAGNDFLTGGTGNDTYLFNLGNGQDTIYDSDPTVGNVDALRFGAGIAANDITFSRSGANLVLGINGTTDQLTILDWKYGNNYRIERMEFADGTAWDAAYLQAQVSALPIVGTDGNDYLFGDEGNNTLSGGAGNDTLRDGIGNDILLGGAGNDRYMFNPGDGTDTIIDMQGSDTLYIGNLTEVNLEGVRNGDNMIINVLGTNNSITLSNWFVQTEGVNRIEFSNHSSLDSMGIKSLLNRSPVANADTVITNEDNVQTIITMASLLANDTDANVGDVITLTGFDGTTANGNAITRDASGNLVLDIGTRYQSLVAGQTAADSFGYTISDSNGAASTSVVNVIITGSNEDVSRASIVHGNEGVGNGEDAPPVGHEENFNDGAAAMPSQPGAKGGNGYSGHSPAYSHRDEITDYAYDAETKEQDKRASATGIRSWFNQQSPSEQYSSFVPQSRHIARESQIDRQVNRSISKGIAGNASSEWEKMNDRLKNHLEQTGADDGVFADSHAGARMPVFFGANGNQGLSQLGTGSSTQMKGFSGLKEGLERLGG